MSLLEAAPLAFAKPSTGMCWLWEPYLASGTLALLDGDPGVGKSLVTIDLAARLSRGDSLPHGSPAGPPRVTLLLSAEDGVETIRSRAEAAGADLNRVVHVTAPMGLIEPLTSLSEVVYRYHADLVVIDPIVSFLPLRAVSDSNQSVRRVLAPLADLAEMTGCTILLVRHLCKSPRARALMRGQGSIGFAAAARSVLMAAKHPADPTLRVLSVAKSNLAGAVPSLGYRIGSNAANLPVVEWTGTVNLAADELGTEPVAALRPRDRASLWLRAELACGPRKPSDLLAAAATAGIPERTLRRAKQQSGVLAHRIFHADVYEWYWYDPTAPWPTEAPFARPAD